MAAVRTRLESLRCCLHPLELHIARAARFGSRRGSWDRCRSGRMLRMPSRVRLGDLTTFRFHPADQCDRGHDLARLAVSALGHVMVIFGELVDPALADVRDVPTSKAPLRIEHRAVLDQEAARRRVQEYSGRTSTGPPDRAGEHRPSSDVSTAPRSCAADGDTEKSMPYGSHCDPASAPDAPSGDQDCGVPRGDGQVSPYYGAWLRSSSCTESRRDSALRTPRGAPGCPPSLAVSALRGTRSLLIASGGTAQRATHASRSTAAASAARGN